jgi:hypothetical protein
VRYQMNLQIKFDLQSVKRFQGETHSTVTFAQASPTLHLALRIPTVGIQATLVIRDLTLRIFAITRLSEKKNREKIVQ